MSGQIKNLINMVGFQLVWWLTALGILNSLWVLIFLAQWGLIALHFKFLAQEKEWQLVLPLALLGWGFSLSTVVRLASVLKK